MSTPSGNDSAPLRSLGCSRSGLWGSCSFAGALIDPGPDRLDYLIYGRYGEPATAAFAAVGAAALVAAARRQALTWLGASATLLVATGLFTGWRLDGLGPARVAVNEGVISGVASFPLDRPGLDLLRWSVTALAAIAVMALARLWGNEALAIMMALAIVAGGVTGSVRAVAEHRAWDNSVLYARYPIAPGSPTRVRVASDALGGTAYSFNMPSQQYALANSGWQLEIVPEESAAVAASVTPDDKMLVLRYTARRAQLGLVLPQSVRRHHRVDKDEHRPWRARRSLLHLS